jgi:inhibitor of KinA
MLFDKPHYRLMGDRALLVELGEGVRRDINERILKMAFGLRERQLTGIVEFLPGYRSLMVTYDPLAISLGALKAAVEGVFDGLDALAVPDHKTVRVPVAYGGHYGPDLPWVARYHRIPEQTVVDLHGRSAYQVYMIGFTPGYPYMGELPEELATPRRQTPRVSIPAGSVGIAQKQTGIYPTVSPGGWQIIGRTPLRLFDPSAQPPALLQAGDRVVFYPINPEEFDRWPS